MSPKRNNDQSNKPTSKKPKYDGDETDQVQQVDPKPKNEVTVKKDSIPKVLNQLFQRQSLNLLTKCKNKEGFISLTSLQLASKEGDTQKVIKLLESGVDVNVQGPNDFTALHFAAANENVTAVTELLENGANIDAMTNINIVTALLENGAAEVDAKDTRHRTPLSLAANKGQLDVVKILLNHGANVNVQDSWNHSPLHESASNGHLEVLKELIKNGANLELKDKHVESTALESAFLGGHIECVQELLKSGAKIPKKQDINNQFEFEPILHHVVSEGSKIPKEMIKILVEHGADIDERDESNNTALHRAIQNVVLEDNRIIKELLKHGANLEATNNDKMTPLMSAAYMKNLEVMKILVQHGAKVDFMNEDDDKTALVYATAPYHRSLFFAFCSYDNVSSIEECMNFLVDNGANIHFRYKDNLTLLHIASLLGRSEAVVELLKLGADANAQAEWQRTPLHCACRKGHLDIATELIKHGANLEMKDKKLDTPLHSAALFGFTEIVELLLKNGANVHAQNVEGSTPLHLADNKEIASILIENGAKLNAQDTDDYTPLHMACIRDKIEVLSLLLSKGADIKMKDSDSRTPLATAKNFEIAKKLVDFGADIHEVDDNGRGLIHQIVEKNNPKDRDVKAITNFLKLGADINAKDANGDSPLHLAAHMNHGNIIKELLKHSANVNATNNDQETPLILAVLSNDDGDTEIICLLIKNGASLEAKDFMDSTALCHAFAERKFSLVKMFLENGANPNSVDIALLSTLDEYDDDEIKEEQEAIEVLMKYSEGTSITDMEEKLTYAIRYKMVSTVELLVRNGANVNAKSEEGSTTPLHQIAYFTQNHNDFTDDEESDAEEEEANVHNTIIPKINLNWERPKYHVCSNENECTQQKDNADSDSNNEEDEDDDDDDLKEIEKSRQIYKIFLDNGADVTATDFKSETALHITDDPKFVSELLDRGADVNAQNNQGKTRLHKAAEKEQMKILKILLKRGADVHLKQINGLSTLEQAVKEKSIFVVKEIVNHVNIDKTEEILDLLDAAANLPDSGSIKEFRKLQGMVKAKMCFVTNSQGEKVDISHY